MSSDVVRARLIAGDIGGTKTLLGVFDPAGPRPRPVAVQEFATLDFDDLPAMIAAFLDAHASGRPAIGSACFGVAGPVIGRAATLTNVPWSVDAAHVADRFGWPRVSLLNDLQAMAYSVPVLLPSELHVLQPGRPAADGNLGLIAAGTGLGEALLHRVNGSLAPSATEAGHADFAARTEREIVLLRALSSRYGRVDVERVVSGPGLVNIFTVTHTEPCAAGVDPDEPEAGAAISAAAIGGRCSSCMEALDLFVEAYGAEAGNMALRMVATGGVFIGGGIAPKILPAIDRGGFMRAFRAKAPLESLVADVPVKVILNAEAGLLGAAVYASVRL